MARFTRELRQQIVHDFAVRNNGWFDPAAFLAHVREAGAEHPAYSWFEWADDKAANEYRLDQARDFARGLTVRFEVQTEERRAVVVSQSAPLIISPMRNRHDGGGYHLMDPNDPSHMAEHCRQAAQSLRWYISRYEAAVRFAGGDIEPLERVRALLDSASSDALPEAAE